VCNGYWSSFVAQQLGHGIKPYEDHQYLHEICQYIRHHAIDQVALRINMKVSDGELEAAEATFVTYIDCLMKDIMLINYHWGLCAQLDNQWRLQVQGIDQYTTLVLWDHKAFLHVLIFCWK
jgi:hypothetical protein